MSPSFDKSPLQVKSEATKAGSSQTLLLIDSEADSVRLIRKAFRLNPLVQRLIVVRAPREAIDVMRQQGRHARDPRPTMVLADAGVQGGIDAIEALLRDLKADRTLESIPVVVIGSDVPEEDVNRLYSAKANCFIQRPSDPGRLQDLVLTTCQFWLAVANWSTQSATSRTNGNGAGGHLAAAAG
ncbi:MAG TPA: hypothetical protein VE621_03455 [Bryobacteraceae bacterium]|nr:hypothetical protein [Bryobacteraceae bacterium]